MKKGFKNGLIKKIIGEVNFALEHSTEEELKSILKLVNYELKNSTAENAVGFFKKFTEAKKKEKLKNIRKLNRQIRDGTWKPKKVHVLGHIK
jgi:thermostable 8-oxoguanine DNA glycosylase